MIAGHPRPASDRREITKRLLFCVIKPFVTADWWNKTLDLIGQMARETPCYVARFDKSGEIIRDLKGFSTLQIMEGQEGPGTNKKGK